ncbi:MAG: helicase [Bauldia sp.]|nr:helicase [Bauldia sp.]
MNIQDKAEAMPGVGGRNVTAVLGPTNTGKTHLAIERMLAHPSGVIGLPLRLLAREVYNRIVQRVGADAVALVTGEEKIIPAKPRFRVATVEALPAEIDASFLAIDEIQLAADLERGHVFTDRILNLRGRDETLLLGAATMRGVIERLIPGVNIVTRPRLSVLTYAGQKKITRLPPRSAAVAFSADEVYAIGELIRRQRGGVAVVLGALSPRTRNAQVELFQNGDVEFLVATDAIGMGLNLDLDHVAFASDRKFDGYQYRRLNPAELAQVAGRAGRHTRDGTFGVTGRVEPFDDELVAALESHRFQAVKFVQWRNGKLDFASLADLRASLDRPPRADGLVKAPPADDETALEAVCRDPGVAGLADRATRVALLWDVCQIPDYRRIAPANHAELVTAIFRDLARKGRIDEDWFAAQVAHADRTDGDIDTLANRIAHIRTWTYAANRPDWLAQQVHWQERTRAIEDRLSDALHERLTQRFVDRRTSVLMRRLRENAMLETEITGDGDVVVEGQHVGKLQGFRFIPDPEADGPDAKAIRAAAQKALAGEITRRAEGIAKAPNDQFVLASDGMLRWQGIAVARLIEGDDILRPRLLLLADQELSGPARDGAQARLELWLTQHIDGLLKPLFDLRTAETLAPLARGVAFRLSEGLGVVERPQIAEDIRGLDQEMRASLRQLGVRFGAHHIYVPALLKPAPSALLAKLWGLKHGGLDTPGILELPQLNAAGRTTIPHDPAFPAELYRVAGFRVAGQRAVRLDILERLADLIRPLLDWRPNPNTPTPPPGVAPGGGFLVTPAMMSLLGASGEDFASVLRSLGYRMERRPAPKPVEAPAEPVEAAPEAEAAAPEADAAEATASDAVAEASEPTAGDVPVADAAAEASEPTGGDVPVADIAGTAPATVAVPSADTSTEDVALAESVAASAEESPEAIDETLAADEVAPAIPAEDAGLGAVVADAPEGDAGEEVAAESTPAETAPAEPEMIEVWRPGRPDRNRQRGPRRPQGNRPVQPPADAAIAATEDGAGRENGKGGRRPRHERNNRDERQASGRPPRREGEGERQGRPQGKSGRPHGNRRPDRRDRDNAPMRLSASPPRREQKIDPDSPFAALAALKADLERRQGD